MTYTLHCIEVKVHPHVMLFVVFDTYTNIQQGYSKQFVRCLVPGFLGHPISRHVTISFWGRDKSPRR